MKTRQHNPAFLFFADLVQARRGMKLNIFLQYVNGSFDS